LAVHRATDVVDRVGQRASAGIEAGIGGGGDEAQVVEPVAGAVAAREADRRPEDRLLAGRLIERIRANRQRSEHTLVTSANADLVIPARAVRTCRDGVTVRRASRGARREAVTHA